MGEVACIGAGTVGQAWAALFAKAGYQVALYDTSPAALSDRALEKISDALGLLAATGFLKEPVDEVRARIRTVASIKDAVGRAVYVQESVREDVEVKRAVFREIAEHAPADGLLSSSTSAIRGSAFLGEIHRPERALVAHPVNPPSMIALVELCGSEWTAPETLKRAHEFLSAIGMKPVIVSKEIDGFILNRLQYTLVAEAMHLVGEGYCSVEDLDRVVKYGLAPRWATIGPFEVAHLNAAKGFEGFVEQLGPMMKEMGRQARTDYDWSEALASAIHETLAKRTPVQEIPDRQHWRNERILAVRKTQED